MCFIRSSRAGFLWCSTSYPSLFENLPKNTTETQKKTAYSSPKTLIRAQHQPSTMLTPLESTCARSVSLSLQKYCTHQTRTPREIIIEPGASGTPSQRRHNQQQPPLPPAPRAIEMNPCFRRTSRTHQRTTRSAIRAFLEKNTHNR